MQQFKTESKRILDLMINSIYTNKEIFLRELISNASDAIDKMHFASLTDSSVNQDFYIRIEVDEQSRTLSIIDNGIGMTRDELDKNLGTIASSGTLAFKQENENADEQLIGQFGVGFYSAFMVAKRVEVLTRAYGSDEAYLWASNGVEGYTVTEAQKDEVGSRITLYLKDDEEDVDYSEFCNEYTIKGLVRKYSDYIRYPIRMDRTIKENKKDADGKDIENEYTERVETETLNSMTPIWKKQKSEITQEDYDTFYSMTFFDWEKPLKVVHANLEGTVSYTALLYFPSKAAADYYSKEYKKGLALYSNGVLIMEKCEQLLPDYLGFVRGVIDSSDISLNISREMLQQDRQLKAIANGIEKKIIAELKKMLENEREDYEKLFAQFGTAIKFGAYNDYGAKKDQLKDIILFRSAREGKMLTLSEYAKNAKEGQEHIYYVCGESKDKVVLSPQAQVLTDKGYEVLYLTEDVDEFLLRILGEYERKKFKSALDKDLDLGSEDEKKAIEDKEISNKDLTGFIKDALGDKVEKVALASLGSFPVALSYEGEVSLEMEKVFKSMKAATPMPVVAKKVLLLNADHAIMDKLRDLFNTDHETLKKYVSMLFTRAMLAEGFEVDVNEYLALVDELLIK